MLRFDVGVSLLLKVRQFGNAGRHDVAIEDFVKLVLADFFALKRIGADAESDVLGLQAGDGALQLAGSLGGLQQEDTVAMDDHFEVQVLGADRIDVVLNVLQRALVGLIVLTTGIVDVVDDLLLAVTSCVGRSNRAK